MTGVVDGREQAIEAAAAEMATFVGPVPSGAVEFIPFATRTVVAAEPFIRRQAIEEIVGALRDVGPADDGKYLEFDYAADFIEREFLSRDGDS